MYACNQRSVVTRSRIFHWAMHETPLATCESLRMAQDSSLSPSPPKNRATSWHRLVSATQKSKYVQQIDLAVMIVMMRTFRMLMADAVLRAAAVRPGEKE